MSRAYTIYASAYETERLHQLRAREWAYRPIRIELNAVLPVGVTVSSVTWNLQGQSVAGIESQAIAARSFSAWLRGLSEGRGEIEATATTSDGQVMVFRIAVWVER